VITFGGDGTILHVSHLFQGPVPPIVSFSLGTLGFLAPFEISKYEEVIQKVMKGDVSVAHRMRLACNMDHPRTDQELLHVLNEVAFRADSGVLATLDCFLDGQFFTSLLGDGVMVATSTGSTAYSLSCGGSIVAPSVHSILLTPINARSIFYCPAILPNDTEVIIQLSQTSRDLVDVWFDGRAQKKLSRGASIKISRSPYPILTVNKENTVSDWVRSTRRMIRHVSETTYDYHLKRDTDYIVPVHKA